jgi:ATP-dependent protease HslVU (ClpYQ) ATPase subunit
MSLTNYVNNIISSTLENIDKSQQLQTEIHPEIHFEYNSIILLISRRGVGKTFAVLRELIKLSQLPYCGGYTTFLYVSDKTNDATVNELISHIALRVRIVEYNSLLIKMQ